MVVFIISVSTALDYVMLGVLQRLIIRVNMFLVNGVTAMLIVLLWMCLTAKLLPGLEKVENVCFHFIMGQDCTGGVLRLVWILARLGIGVLPQ